MLKTAHWMALVLVFVSGFSTFARSTFPKNPDTTLTPGSVCKRANHYRYPERVAYCERNVDKSRKQESIRNYNQKLGYNILPGERSSFKIDHLIPLCAGGSNELDNLWPQHKSIYEITDPLEPLICEKMSQGRLKQAKAIEYIRRAKLHLEEVDQVMSEIQDL